MSADREAQNNSQLTEAIRELSEIVRIVMTSQEHQTSTQDRMLRRDLRWRNLRAALICISVVGGSLLYSLGLQRIFAPQKFAGPYAALVRIEGMIDADQKANAHKVNAALTAAFEDDKAKGVVVAINSPGGTPVQSALIHDRLQALRTQYPSKKVWVVGEDMLTSGAYFVAVGANHICVNRSTMTGSIGVIMSGWGLDRTIARYGVERRVITAGSNKNRLDAFMPLRPQDQAKAALLLSSVHTQFIDAVKLGRGARLKGDPELLYSGDYWTGEEALDLGLVDGLCDLTTVLDKSFGVSQVKDYTAPPSVWGALSNSFGVFAQQFITDAAGQSVPQPRLLP